VSTERHHIEVGGIAVEIVRKEIKNLHVGVYPPAGRVRVAAPQRLDDEAVRLAVVSRLGWIRRKQKEFAGQDRQSQREMVTGESHYFQGRRYRLDVKARGSKPGVRLTGPAAMELRVPPRSGRDEREAALLRWYRREFRALLPPLLAKWEPRVGTRVAEVRIKKMKTRWGSCNADARRIWLNLELIKKPVACLEYVLVHEMVHLSERHHTERFQERMERLMPTWRLHRDELNHAPLAHEEWTY
jgi:predicted metal-dependent hydrolase